MILKKILLLTFEDKSNKREVRIEIEGVKNNQAINKFWETLELHYQ
jgi:hypothetical protein